MYWSTATIVNIDSVHVVVLTCDEYCLQFFHVYSKQCTVIIQINLVIFIILVIPEHIYRTTFFINAIVF